MDYLKFIYINTFLFFILGFHVCAGQEDYGHYNLDSVTKSTYWAKKKQLALQVQIDSAENKLNRLLKLFSREMEGCHTVKSWEERQEEVLQMQDSINTFRKNALKQIDSTKRVHAIYIKNKVYLAIESYKAENKITYLYPRRSVVYCDNCSDFTDEIIKYINSAPDRTN